MLIVLICLVSVTLAANTVPIIDQAQLSESTVTVDEGPVNVTVSCTFDIDSSDEVTSLIIQYGPEARIDPADTSRQFSCDIRLLGIPLPGSPTDEEFFSMPTTLLGIPLPGSQTDEEFFSMPTTLGGCSTNLSSGAYFSTQEVTLWIEVPYSEVSNSRFWVCGATNEAEHGGLVSEVTIIGTIQYPVYEQQDCTQRTGCITFNVAASLEASPGLSAFLQCGTERTVLNIEDNYWANLTLAASVRAPTKKFECLWGISRRGDTLLRDTSQVTVDYGPQSCPCSEFSLGGEGTLGTCFGCDCSYRWWWGNGSLLSGETSATLSLRNHVKSTGAFRIILETCHNEADWYCVNTAYCINAVPGRSTTTEILRVQPGTAEPLDSEDLEGSSEPQAVYSVLALFVTHLVQLA